MKRYIKSVITPKLAEAEDSRVRKAAYEHLKDLGL